MPTTIQEANPLCKCQKGWKENNYSQWGMPMHSAKVRGRMRKRHLQQRLSAIILSPDFPCLKCSGLLIGDLCYHPSTDFLPLAMPLYKYSSQDNKSEHIQPHWRQRQNFQRQAWEEAPAYLFDKNNVFPHSSMRFLFNLRRLDREGSEPQQPTRMSNWERVKSRPMRRRETLQVLTEKAAPSSPASL